MTNQPVLDLTIAPVAPRPFAHVVAENFIREDLYHALEASFPTCGRNSGPTGYTCFPGDAEYDQLMAANPAWRALHEAVHTQAFIDYCLAQFREIFAAESVVDLTHATYAPYIESRADKQRRHLERVELAPDQLWVRLDIMQGQVGYSRARHVDHRRRAISMLIYFSDADEQEMVGGDLVLHKGRGGAADAIRPRRNRMAVFPCGNASYHSVSPIIRQKAPRNFVQVTVSSSVDLWRPQPLPEMLADGLASRLHKLAKTAGLTPALAAR